MQAPSFWWRKPGAAATLLRPLATAYGGIAARRMGQAGEGVGIPVVCIGNPTVGGSGKTPTVLATARLLADAGERPAFLTRGYGGRLKGPLAVDANSHQAVDVGDEPLLLARVFPTIVARDRVAGARLARDAGATVIVMDDGFQNPSLAKNCAILVVDGERGIGNGLVFPAGPLRAPLAFQLRQAHAIVVIGTGTAAASVINAAMGLETGVFEGSFEPAAHVVATLRRQPVLAFAGIGNPDKFFATLATAGIDARVRHSFPDHHFVTTDEASRLLREAERENLSLVTTEKDFVRLQRDGVLGDLRAATRALPITLAFSDEIGFRRFVLRRIRSNA